MLRLLHFLSLFRFIKPGLDKRFEIGPISGAFHLFNWNETQRGRIDAVAQSSWPGAVIENMAQVGVAGLGPHFGAFHEVRRITLFDDLLLGHCPAEAGPAATRI